jgi:hypothetical protein
VESWGVAAVVAVLVLVLLAWQLTFSAARLDRLHHRVEAARAALDAQLVRRASAAVDLANSGLLDPARSMVVAGAAVEALAAGAQHEEDPSAADDPAGTAAGALSPSDAADRLPDRETAESNLTRALQVALSDADEVAALRHDPYGRDLLGALAAAFQRAQMARRFHNDAVLQAQRVRRKRLVRWTRLAGRAAMPATVEMDDEPPAPLGR